MNDAQKRQHMQSLASELAGSLEHLRDALTDLSLTLKDGQMHLNTEATRSAERLAEETLKHCRRPSILPPG